MSDLVQAYSQIQKIINKTKSVKQRQKKINVSDVWYGWDILQSKYDFILILNLFINIAKDADLVIIIKKVLSYIKDGAHQLENYMTEYAIPMPPRPMEGTETTTNLDIITDKYIFNNLFYSLKDLNHPLLNAFLDSASPIPRVFFKNHLFKNIELIDDLSIYGELKGYIQDLPEY